jgi:hypothetical protein
VDLGGINSKLGVDGDEFCHLENKTFKTRMFEYWGVYFNILNVLLDRGVGYLNFRYPGSFIP